MNKKEVRLFRNWWLLMLKGILIFTIGLAFISTFWVHLMTNVPNYKVLIFAFIITTMINGILILYGAFNYSKRNASWIFWLIEGSFDCVLGIAGIIGIIIVGVVKTHVLNMFLIQIIAVWAFIHGLIHTAMARRLRQYVAIGRYALIAGLVVIACSISLILKPFLFTLQDSIYAGVVFTLIGLSLSIISLIIRKIYSD